LLPKLKLKNNQLIIKLMNYRQIRNKICLPIIPAAKGAEADVPNII